VGYAAETIVSSTEISQSFSWDRRCITSANGWVVWCTVHLKCRSLMKTEQAEYSTWNDCMLLDWFCGSTCHVWPVCCRTAWWSSVPRIDIGRNMSRLCCTSRADIAGAQTVVPPRFVVHILRYTFSFFLYMSRFERLLTAVSVFLVSAWLRSWTVVFSIARWILIDEHVYG